MLKENDKIKVHIFDTQGKEIQTRNVGTVFEVRKENEKLGIDWNIERVPYCNNGNVFTPFETFSYTVVFENVENGKKYHYSNAANEVIEMEE